MVNLCNMLREKIAIMCKKLIIVEKDMLMQEVELLTVLIKEE